MGATNNKTLNDLAIEIANKRIERETPKKRSKTPAVILLLIITISATGAFLLTTRQQVLVEENAHLRAMHTKYNDISPNPICRDDLTMAWNDQPVCGG